MRATAVGQGEGVQLIGGDHGWREASCRFVERSVPSGECWRESEIARILQTSGKHSGAGCHAGVQTLLEDLHNVHELAQGNESLIKIASPGLHLE